VPYLSTFPIKLTILFKPPATPHIPCSGFGYTYELRHALVISLLAVMVGTLLPQGLSGTSESQLPACCRRAGKHNCVMLQAGHEAVRSSSLRSIREKCPYGPAAGSFGVRTTSYFGPCSPSLHCRLAIYRAPAAQAETKRRISLDRSRQKRGPPVFFS
jgi:hypothetical protein